MNWSTWHKRGTKNKSESPTGIKPMTLLPFHISLPSLKCTIFIHFITLKMTSTVLIVAVCRTPVTYELSKMTLLSMSSRSSVDREPARCSGGHGFDSCGGFRFFVWPPLVSCWSVHFSIAWLFLINQNCYYYISFCKPMWSVNKVQVDMLPSQAHKKQKAGAQRNTKAPTWKWEKNGTKNHIYILPAKFAIVQSCSVRLWL